MPDFNAPGNEALYNFASSSVNVAPISFGLYITPLSILALYANSYSAVNTTFGYIAPSNVALKFAISACVTSSSAALCEPVTVNLIGMR
jgi:hypothetical protein